MQSSLQRGPAHFSQAMNSGASGGVPFTVQSQCQYQEGDAIKPVCLRAKVFGRYPERGLLLAFNLGDVAQPLHAVASEIRNKMPACNSNDGIDTIAETEFLQGAEQFRHDASSCAGLELLIDADARYLPNIMTFSNSRVWQDAANKIAACKGWRSVCRDQAAHERLDPATR